MGFLTSLFETRTPPAPPVVEQRGVHPSTDQDWGEFFGAPKMAGLTAPSVNESMALPAVYACINVISSTMASLPLITYRQLRNGARERATDHPLYLLLHRRPNREMTAFELQELMSSHTEAWGNGYAEIDMDNAGNVRELWPMLPQNTFPYRENGEKKYDYILPNGQMITLPAWKVVHFHGLGGNGLSGYSPIRVAMLSVALGLATEEFGARFFSQGAQPRFVLSHPGVLDDPAWQRLDKRWNRTDSLSQAHRVKIIEEGMKVEKIGIPPEEAQFLQTRYFQAEEVARLFRVPPHKIGLLEKATFSNIEHQAIEWVVDGVRPRSIRAEQAMWRDLLSETEQRTIYMEYMLDGLLRGDTMTRYEAYTRGRQWGWLSVNDIRRLENLEPVKNGDIYLQPLNMVQAGAAQGGVRSFVAPLAERDAQWVTRREAADLRSRGAKILRKEPEQFDAWLTSYYDELRSAATQHVASTATAVTVATGRDVAPDVQATLADATARSMAQIRLIVAEAPAHGETPADALNRYAGTIETAGAGILCAALMEAMEVPSDKQN